MDFCVCPKGIDINLYPHVFSKGCYNIGAYISDNIFIENSSIEIGSAARGISRGISKVNALKNKDTYLSSSGNFAIITIVDDEVLAITDTSGSIPVYYGVTDTGPVLSSRAQEVSRLIGSQTFDPVSVADFIANGTVCHPWTLHSRVWALPPASVCRLTRRGIDCTCYWKPVETQPRGSLQEWASRLHECVKKELHLGLENVESVNVLFSGGEDSRTVASLLPDHVDATLISILHGPNREHHLARQAAHAMSCRYKMVRRPSGFYRRDIAGRVACIGSGWDVRHTHIYGETGNPYRSADAVVGGYAADTLFKTAWMGNVRKPHLLAAEKLALPDPERIIGIRTSCPNWIHEDIWAAVQERRWKYHIMLREFRPTTAGNWHTLWPLGGHRIAYGHFLSCLRLGPLLVEPFLSNAAYQLAAEMPDKFRVDRRVFRVAFARSMGFSGWLPTSSGTIPRIGGPIGAKTAFATKAMRRLSDVWTNSRRRRVGLPDVVQGSWDPDHKGHFPNPEEFLGTLLKCRVDDILKIILDSGDPNLFWYNNNITDVEKLRATQFGLIDLRAF